MNRTKNRSKMTRITHTLYTQHSTQKTTNNREERKRPEIIPFIENYITNEIRFDLSPTLEN